jgi:hypothetical protein
MDIDALAAVHLPGTDGGTHRVGDFFAHKPVVLVFARHFG